MENTSLGTYNDKYFHPKISWEILCLAKYDGKYFHPDILL